MAIFTYEAYNRDGVVQRGEYEGSSRDDIVAYLVKKEFTPVSIELMEGTKGAKGGLLALTLFESLTPVDILFLVRNLATMMKAGLSVLEALDILILDAANPMMKRILRETQVMVKNGQQLSKGFENYKKSFPPIFIGMVRAGELSGQLDKTLGELAQYLVKEYNLRSKVKSALMYPAILLVASTGVVGMLLIFVLPRLTKAFLSSGVALPFVTKFFLGISSALTYSLYIDLGVVGFFVWFFTYFRKTVTGKKMFFWILMHAPVAKDLVKKVALVRFARTLSNLISSGLSAVESLQLSAQSIGNHSYTVALEFAITEVKNGKPISDSLGRYPDLFPRIFISLLIVGERTGSLQSILATFADFYDEEVDNKLKDLTAILEPLMLMFMGILVGAIAVAIILPIYQLVGHFT